MVTPIKVTLVIKTAAGNIRSGFSLGKINFSAQVAKSTVIKRRINLNETTFSIPFENENHLVNVAS